MHEVVLSTLNASMASKMLKCFILSNECSDKKVECEIFESGHRKSENKSA